MSAAKKGIAGEKTSPTAATGKNGAAPQAKPKSRGARRRLAFAGLTALCLLPHSRGAEFWDIAAWQRAPAVEWGARDGLIQEVYYTGEPHAGKPTRVFAYLGRPESGDNALRHPAVVLVHGGGGQAFRPWAERWAQRGYVALAMDLSGNGPGKVRMPDGGPALGNPNIFLRAENDAAFREGWPYHAVAAAIRGHSLLAALPEVDSSRIALTGISWGGFVACTVASLDHRFKVAVPVYGCGFLHEDSFWKEECIEPMTAAQRARWVQLYDPSSFLARVKCPILFVTGANDPRFYLDSHRRSVELVRPELRHLAVIVGLKHGHLFAIPEVDQFIDAAINRTALPPRMDRPIVAGAVVRARLSAPVDDSHRAELHYASATGPWAERKWSTAPATVKGSFVSAPIPPVRPALVYFSVVDPKGVRATSTYAELVP